MTTNTEVTKTGALGKDPIPGEGKGTNYCRFPIAVETPVTPGDWRGEMRTDWYEVTCFGTVADNAFASLAKGDRVTVVGKPEVETWTGRDNQERTTKRILASTVAVDLRFNSVRINRTANRSAPQTHTGPDEF